MTDVYGYGVEKPGEYDNALKLCCIIDDWYWCLGSGNVFKKTSREEIENSIFYKDIYNRELFKFELKFNDEFGGFRYGSGEKPDYKWYKEVEIEIEPEN